MAKIAILCCGNIKNELSCAASACFCSFNAREGMFERYKDDNELQIVGFSLCAGCPTLYAPAKIMRKIKPLVEMAKAEKIHLSTCMMEVCPFVAKYIDVINDWYPNVEIVEGTEATPGKHHKLMETFFKKLLTDHNPDITEEYNRTLESEE